jgi:Raf kinase inhibitor-like YbhB/YbcL family protein
MAIEVTSTAFKQGQTIPKRHTGEGEDLSPPLAWSGVPAAARELVLVVDDPDAPGGTWDHWVLYGIPADRTSLPEGVGKQPQPREPAGAAQGPNSWGETDLGYRGPMPPPGHGTHHYHFHLYALDAPLKLPPGVNKSQLLKKIQGHVLAEGELMGVYSR